jgi:hypothetical protein
MTMKMPRLALVDSGTLRRTNKLAAPKQAIDMSNAIDDQIIVQVSLAMVISQ